MMSSNDYYNNKPRLLGFFTATSIVVANMIGTGIFTTTGFLAFDLGSPFTILLVWLVGGVLAICGALAYGELAAAMPRSGGEYHYLSRIYHPAIGFLSGWVSLIVGFSAPIAASAIAFGKYLFAVYPVVSSTHAAVILVIIFSLLHLIDIRIGSYTQNFFAVLKVALILAFIVSGFILLSERELNLFPDSQDLRMTISPTFAVALIFVSFSYSGWNAATYIGGEIKNPGRNLPRSLLLGVLIVMLLYLGLNLVFVLAVPMSALAGKVEVGHIVAKEIFGVRRGNLIAMLISLALVSSVSAMIMAGPRVYQAMGEDIPFFKILSIRTKRATPFSAIILQMIIAIIMILTATFKSLLYYIGFTLSIFASLTVLGVYIFRFKRPNDERPYRTLGYPVTPALFVLLSGWMVIHTVIERPLESLAGIGTLFLGLMIYYITVYKARRT